VEELYTRIVDGDSAAVQRLLPQVGAPASPPRSTHSVGAYIGALLSQHMVDKAMRCGRWAGFQCAEGTIDLPHVQTGRTALWEAVARGQADTTRALLAAGADPNVAHPLSGPPLLHAAAWGELTLLQLLLDHGANVDGTDAKRFTALHYACHGGHPQAAAVLLAAGASPYAQTITGHMPASLACEPEVIRTQTNAH
jgi:hypothetical protein